MNLINECYEPSWSLHKVSYFPQPEVLVSLSMTSVAE